MSEDDIDDALELLDESGDGEITFDGTPPPPPPPLGPPASSIIPLRQLTLSSSGDTAARRINTATMDRSNHILHALEFRDWWMEEKASEPEAAPAQMMTLKERMKALMKEQEDRQANIGHTNFQSDLANVNLQDKKAAVDAAGKAKKTKKFGWDIEKDLANRENTASVIMDLFNRQATTTTTQPGPTKRAPKWQVNTSVGFLATATADSVNRVKDMGDGDDEFMDDMGDDDDDGGEEIVFTTLKDRLASLALDDTVQGEESEDDEESEATAAAQATERKQAQEMSKETEDMNAARELREQATIEKQKAEDNERMAKDRAAKAAEAEAEAAANAAALSAEAEMAEIAAMAEEDQDEKAKLDAEYELKKMEAEAAQAAEEEAASLAASAQEEEQSAALEKLAAEESEAEARAKASEQAEVAAAA
eukprot:COSAG05_NODE_2004_length_3719_cov_28.261393_4_plen_421_part_01